MKQKSNDIMQVTDVLYTNFINKLDECNKTRLGFAETYDKNSSWFTRVVRERHPTIQLQLIVQMAEYVGCTPAELLTARSNHEIEKKI
ncbi:hypothetical protein [Breznakia pachnodae]|uniref:HTH cro/C1-type domain-containing protein n=1 Tax=Breznakia pachnodae TaxID=265178 RepID=A0ABU0E6Q2_9FIRM|nr:hypothetical protein [Breznakia pachnodae]MDQ0362582.1 hypothetical protein [Breznakia pachnodae]